MLLLKKEVIIMTGHVVKHEFFHGNPFEYFTPFSKFSIMAFIIGIVFFIVVLLVTSSILSVVILFLKLISG